tara:strand:- start:238 stop:399 length:162 start_codon:yes stop_codon:yes gene_type:complete
MDNKDKNISFAISTMMYQKELPDIETLMAVHNLTKKQSKKAIAIAKQNKEHKK